MTYFTETDIDFETALPDDVIEITLYKKVGATPEKIHSKTVTKQQMEYEVAIVGNEDFLIDLFDLQPGSVVQDISDVTPF